MTRSGKHSPAGVSATCSSALCSSVNSPGASAAYPARYTWGSPPTANPPTPPPCHFNISHSGDYLCIAFHHQAIGVDIERIRQRSFARLAPRFMAPEQLHGFRERGCPESEFFTCWCTAEALIKHAGSTIWQAHDFPFLFDRGQIIPLYENAPRVHLFSPAPGYSGAVAFTQTS